MAYEARVFQILIASPGDVQEERKILADVIYEWNSVNSRDRSVVLLPLRWETSSTPEMGSPAQAVINKQVVDQCDMAIGIFWTRLGTPTLEAESGTAEEIERVGKAGKHVMLYFSRAKVDPDQLDMDEYKRLKKFKEKTYPQGLIESYDSLPDFREKLTRQLAMKLLALIAEQSRERALETVSTHEPLAIVLASDGTLLTSPVKIQQTKLVCSNPEDIPIFTGKAQEENEEEKEESDLRIGISARLPNRQYYRQMVEFMSQRTADQSFRLGLRSLSEHGFRDIYLEMRVEPVTGEFRIVPAPGPRQPPSEFTSGMTMIGGTINTFYGAGTPSAELVIANSASLKVTTMEMELPFIHTQRTIFSTNSFAIETGGSPASAIIYTTVYSSDKPPFSLQMEIEVEIKEIRMTYQQILEEFGKFLDGRDSFG